MRQDRAQHITEGSVRHIHAVTVIATIATHNQTRCAGASNMGQQQAMQQSTLMQPCQSAEYRYCWSTVIHCTLLSWPPVACDSSTCTSPSRYSKHHAAQHHPCLLCDTVRRTAVYNGAARHFQTAAACRWVALQCRLQACSGQSMTAPHDQVRDGEHA